MTSVAAFMSRTAWKHSTTADPTPRSYFRPISCPAAYCCMAVGGYYEGSGQPFHPLAEQYASRLPVHL
jgi:hypothetical protein